MVRKFLYFFAGLIVFVIAGGFVFSIYQDELTDFAIGQLEPTVKFEKQAALATNVYDDPQMWFSRGDQKEDNPTLWRPVGAPENAIPGSAAIFFVHPTSFMARTHWNAPLDDQESQDRARLFLRGLATPFADAGEIWAPRYRQAGIYAFLTTEPDGAAALNDAYQDVLLAFDHFVKNVQKDRPIILVGHSQGALHLTHLMKDRIAGRPVAKRIVAAYVIGWPVSVTTDIPAMGLPVCNSPDQIGCVMGWESYAEPARYGKILELYNATTGFDGTSRKDTLILCTNPLNGGSAVEALATANLGTLKPSGDMSTGELIAETVPARCDDKGFLLIGEPVDMGPYVLPGNNYHVYDIPLFWANIRADALLAYTEISGKMIFDAALDFRDALPDGGVLIGLDVGSKTIGTAFCDAGWTYASPADLIRRSKFTKDKAALVAAIATRQTKGIVVGLPLNMDGSESPRSQSSRAFARNIEDLGLPILLRDERWSTQAIEREMIAADMSRAKRAEKIDSGAAAFILQGAIDALTSG